MGITAIFGGTFNPFHIGHYEILVSLQNDPEIEEIWLLPDKIPPHKACDFLAQDDVRIEMCKIAAEDFSKVKLCLIEFEREGKSYTYDTISILKEKFPEKKFAFVCGGDMLVFFPRWYKYDELIKMLEFIVFKRTDTNIDEFNDTIAGLTELGMKLKVKQEVITTISSSVIRENFDTFSEFLPPKIYAFLKERGEYVKQS